MYTVQLFISTTQVFWDNHSENKPEYNYFTNYMVWTEISKHSINHQDTFTASINLKVSAIEAPDSVTMVWFNRNGTNYYYLVKAYTLEGTNVVLDLELDLWSTYLMPFFNSEDNSLIGNYNVYYDYWTRQPYMFNNQTTSNTNEPYVLNIRPDESTNELAYYNTAIYKGQAPGFTWKTPDCWTGNLNNTDMTYYLWAVVKTNDTNNNFNPDGSGYASGWCPMTYIVPIATNNSPISATQIPTLQWTYTPMTPQELIQNAAGELIQVVATPFCFTDLIEPGTPFYLTDWAFDSYSSVTGNDAGNFNNTSALGSPATGSSMFAPYTFALPAYKFVLANKQISTVQNIDNINSSGITKYPTSAALIDIWYDVYTFYNMANQNAPKQLLLTDTGAMYEPNQIPLYNLLKLFPYLINFYSRIYQINNNSVELQYNQFMNFAKYLGMNETFALQPSYPGLSLYISNSQIETNGIFANTLGQTYNNTITNNIHQLPVGFEVASVSNAWNDFANQYKKIINNANTLKNMSYASSAIGIGGSLLGAGMSLMDGNIGGVFSGLAGIANEGMDIEKAKLSYSDSYGAAKEYALKRQSQLNANQTSPTNTNILFTQNFKFVQTNELASILTKLELYGYSYQNYAPLADWCQMNKFNYIKLSGSGLDAFTNSISPNKSVRLELLKMLNDGVRIWTVTPYFNNWYNVINWMINNIPPAGNMTSTEAANNFEAQLTINEPKEWFKWS